MANVIRIKRSTGAAAPSGLAQGELAHVEQQGTGDGRLYIGVGGAGIEEIGGKFYVDLLNSYDADLATFALPASTTISAFGATIIDDADASAVLTTLGIDTDLLTTTIGATATLTGSNTGDQTITLTGDVTGTGTGSFAATIAADAVTYAKMQNVVANNVFLGNNAGAGGIVDELTGTEATALLSLFATTSTVQGLVPGSNNLGATYFLDGSGTWSVPAGGGDVVGPGPTVTDNTIARFDGTGGLTIQSTGIVIADTTNDVTGMGTLNGKTIANLVSTTDAASAGWTFVIDDDTMATASATTLPTSESVKAYVDTAVTSGVTYQGAFDPTAGAGAGSPDLDTITSTTGDMYTVTVAGTYNWTTGSAILEVGDVLIAEADGVLNNVASWTIVQNNLSAATQTTPGYVSVGAQTFGGTKTFEDIAGTDVAATLDSFVIDGGSF